MAVGTLVPLRAWDAVALCLELLAAVMADDGSHRHHHAVRLLAAAQTYRKRYQQPAPVPRAGQVQGLSYRLREHLGSVAYADEWRAGRALTVSELLTEQGRVRSAARCNPQLTKRQLQVAELVASGLTNQAIARRLGVAPWTVVNHVRQVLRKLEFTSRVQVARWFAEQRSEGEHKSELGPESGNESRRWRR